MTDKIVYLHAGCHKTGSSSIQNTIKNNIDLLERNGISYPNFDNEHRSHSGIFSDMFLSKSKLSSKKNKETLVRLLASSNKLIISDEAISTLSLSHLEEIFNLFKQAGYIIHVILYVRHPYPAFCSIMQQRIKVGLDDFSDIISSLRFRSQYISNVIKVFSSDHIDIVSYENVCKDKGPVLDFFNRIGVENRDVKIFNSNEGLGNLSTRLYARLNYIEPRRRFSTELVNLDDNKFLLTKEEYSKVEHLFIEENKLIKELLGEDFCDLNIKFSDELTEFTVIDELKLSELYKYEGCDNINEALADFWEK